MSVYVLLNLLIKLIKGVKICGLLIIYHELIQLNWSINVRFYIRDIRLILK